MMRILTVLVAAVTVGLSLSGQEIRKETEARGTPLRLAPTEPLRGQRTPAVSPPELPKSQEVRPAILNLKPPGDPIYVEETKDSEQDWRTYRRPKVDAISRNGEGLAVHGYDMISYREKRAEKGDKRFFIEYGGVRWQFVSADHRDTFQRDPERFLPEYGGFCAYSVGRGYPATADPAAYAVDNGKLYLFFDKAVQIVWEQEKQRLKKDADWRWPQVHR